MSDGARFVNNPSRVPPPVEAVEPVQEGLPRVIHPIGAPTQQVGSLFAALEHAMQPINTFPGADEQYVTIEADATLLSTDGKDSVDFVAGQRVHVAQAARFGLVEAVPVAYARPADEVPDLAPTELERRGLGGAPETATRSGAPQDAAARPAKSAAAKG